MNPINGNNKLNNHHVFIVGMSGSGKTSAAKKLFIKSTDQVVGFDPYGDYRGKLANRVVRSYDNLHDFAVALFAGRKTNQGFKIFYQPPVSKRTDNKDFDRFAKIVWAAGNGQHKKPLKCIFEEVAQHTDTIGKDKGYHGQIMRIGRKYGIHAINIFQRAQEVSKTIIDNCETACVLMQKTPDSAMYLQKKSGIPASTIDKLEPLEYVLQEGKKWKQGKIRF